MKPLLPAFAVLALAAPALAEPITYEVDQPIDDVLFVLESEIIGRGLNIDSVSHVAEMLKRTGKDLGATTEIFIDAQTFSFCSAQLSRQVMEANPANVAYCPYKIFAYATPDRPDVTIVGHEDYPDGEMQAVEDFLTSIVKAALFLE